MKKIVYKVRGKWNKHFGRVENMHKKVAEHLYFDQYWQAMEEYLPEKGIILDIGCQYGRFTIPLSQKGHSIIATDLNDDYFNYIKKQTGKGEVSFYKEDCRVTLNRNFEENLDVLLLFELIYLLPDWKEVIGKGRDLLNDKGLLITSHRTAGFYIYQALKDKDVDQLKKARMNKMENHHWETKEELEEIYAELGFEVVKITPIGVLSGGYSSEPFSVFHSAKDNSNEQTKLVQEMELDPEIQSLFINNARYLMVIARKKK